MQVFDHSAVDRDHALALTLSRLKRLDDLAGRLHLGLVRSEHGVGGIELPRVDQRLAVEAHLGTLAAFGLEALGVAHVVVHTVENDLAGGPRTQQAQTQPGQQWLAAGDVCSMQFLGQVVGAHHQHREALGRGGDVGAVEHRLGRLDHGPDLGVFGRPTRLKPSLDGRHIGGRVHLGHHNGGGPGGRGGRQVVGVPVGVQPVHPDGQLAVAVLAGGQGGHDVVTGLGLGIGRHGILQVEDQRVGGQPLGLLERTRVGAGHVQHRTSGAQSFGVGCTAHWPDPAPKTASVAAW